jgi:hypothetical protein
MIFLTLCLLAAVAWAGFMCVTMFVVGVRHGARGA